MALTNPLPDWSPPRPPRLIPPNWARWLGDTVRARTLFILVGTAAYLLVRPLLALVHELLVLLAAELLGHLGTSGAWAVLNGSIPLDPIYTGTMFLLLSNIQVSGVAVAAPIGAAAHAAWPRLFAAPELVAEGAWASAVIQPGASVIARGLAMLSAEVAFVALGITLVGIGLRRFAPEQGADWRWLAVVGALLQAHIVVNHLAKDPVSLGELEATGLSFAFSILFTGPPSERPRLAAVLGALPEPAQAGVLVAGAIVLVYVLAASVVALPVLVGRAVHMARERRWRRVAGRSLARAAGPRRALAPLGVAAFALGIAISPVGSFAEAESHYLPHEPEEIGPQAALGSTDAPVMSSRPTSEPLAVAVATATAEPTLAPRPTSARPDPVVPPRVRVELDGSGYRFSYRVNGQPQVIRGMGYNPVYGDLSRDERAARYDRDFAAMREAGVNTVVGWDTHAFDELLLERAQRHGLGVIVPYDLPWSIDYTDPAIRDALMRDILDRVARLKDYPAVRMWGPGNEVLHKLVFPSWLHVKGDPAYEARADAFANFYVELIDRIHQLDPDHPVTYRDAEDGYVLRLREALLRDGVQRPWFAYGINIYTTRLAEVIANWPSLGLDNPLLVSEFGPGGAGPGDRPQGYRELWKIIRAQPRYVLGGAPYVWTTEGPEEADRIFGLVDAGGRPVDGSLSMIGRLYRGEAAVDTSSTAADTPHTCTEAVGSLARKTIADLQASPYTITFQARTPPIVIGQLDNLPPDPLRAEDFRFDRSSDPDRLAWQRETGRGQEWWVTWYPPSRPGDQIAMLIRESPELVELAYIYHGPANPTEGGWRC